ncbi:MAG TPA: hypothetical protein VF669_14605 [Tepidisphaeraceae bacterium]
MILLISGVSAWPVVRYAAKLGSVSVQVTNDGADSLSGVIVRVTGAEKLLGDLKPGETKSVNIRCTGDSHVTLIYRIGTHTASLTRDADCYFESGYSGTVEIDVCGDDIKRVRSNVKAF